MCLLGGKSPSVKLMSRRENKKIGQNQPIEHGQNHAKITAYRLYKRSTAPEYIKLMPGMLPMYKRPLSSVKIREGASVIHHW